MTMDEDDGDLIGVALILKVDIGDRTLVHLRHLVILAHQALAHPIPGRLSGLFPSVKICVTSNSQLSGSL